MRILIVDDSADDRAIIRRAARAAFPSAEIVTASTRAEGICALVEGDTDLALLDARLDGDPTPSSELVRCARAHSARVVVVSGDTLHARAQAQPGCEAWNKADVSEGLRA